MSPRVDPKAIASRIRALLIRPNEADLEKAAGRLKVARAALCRSIDSRLPRPSLGVITAIVRELGVDPWWLMYGDYNWGTHALASEIGASITAADILRLVESPKEARVDEPPADNPATQLDA